MWLSEFRPVHYRATLFTYSNTELTICIFPLLFLIRSPFPACLCNDGINCDRHDNCSIEAFGESKTRQIRNTMMYQKTKTKQKHKNKGTKMIDQFFDDLNGILWKEIWGNDSLIFFIIFGHLSWCLSSRSLKNIFFILSTQLYFQWFFSPFSESRKTYNIPYTSRLVKNGRILGGHLFIERHYRRHYRLILLDGWGVLFFLSLFHLKINGKRTFRLQFNFAAERPATFAEVFICCFYRLLCILCSWQFLKIRPMFQ